MGGACAASAGGESDEAKSKPQLERYASARRLGPASPGQLEGRRVEWLEEEGGGVQGHDGAPESKDGTGCAESENLDQSNSYDTHGRGSFTWSGGALAVEVLGARQLANSQFIGKQDPYLLAAPSPSRVTPSATDFVPSGGTTPRWHARLSNLLLVWPLSGDTHITFELWNANALRDGIQYPPFQPVAIKNVLEIFLKSK